MSDVAPVAPVEAATVILTRPGEPAGTPWQCFMVRRHALSDFASNVYVFPGGKVDESDGDLGLRSVCRGHPGPGGTSFIDRVHWRALRVAAIRELFEEAGVLLAERERRVVSLTGAEAERFLDHRRAVHDGELTMLDLARQEKLRYPLDRLHPISRWITPESFPRRFDTYFFVAHLPQDQVPVHDDCETTEGLWIAPAEAVRLYEEGTFPLVFATEMHLRTLARHGSIEGLICSATPSSLAPIMPRPARIDGQTRYLLPGDEGYESASR